MNRHSFSIVFLALFLSACTGVPLSYERAVLQPSEISSISLKTDGCLGPCPIFSVVALANGSGSFEGVKYVERIGKADIEFTSEEFAAFADKIEQFRPARDVAFEYENCPGETWTDQSGVLIEWTMKDGSSTSLSVYFGCKFPGSDKFHDTLYNSWRELPIYELVQPDKHREFP